MKEKKILIVDDERELCRGIEKLVGLKGYRSESVYDGLQAIERVKRESFPLVILDLKMPRLPGEKVFEKIRGLRPKTKVIVLTGHGTVGSAVDLMKKGVSQYLQKPFEAKELLEAIEKEIGPPGGNVLEKELYRSIGAKIHALREKEGLTLQQLAQRTQLSTSLVSQVENGKLSPSLATLLRISQGFKIAVRDLF